MHIEEILNLDVMQYHNLFLELGNALLKREMWERALDCLAVIQECDGVSDKTLLNTVLCHLLIRHGRYPTTHHISTLSRFATIK